MVGKKECGCIMITYAIRREFFVLYYDVWSALG